MRAEPTALATGAALPLGLLAARVQAHDPGLSAALPRLREYVPLGIEHVLIGYDHVAFLLGLMLLARSGRALLSAVTAFTVAHCVTLSACVLGVLTPSAACVEACIAASIVYVAVVPERSAGWRRAALISASFGLIHGFGFAGALEEVGLPLDETPAALGLFNVGVELGQLAVLGVSTPLVRSLQRHPHGTLAMRGALAGLGLALTASRMSELLPIASQLLSAVPP